MARQTSVLFGLSGKQNQLIYSLAMLLCIAASCSAPESSEQSSSQEVTSSGAGSGGGGGGAPHDPPTIRVLDARPLLLDSEASVIVELSSPWDVDVSVQLGTKDGTAKGDPDGGLDYKPVSTIVKIPAGATSAAVSIPVRTPYKKLTLETALASEFSTHLSEPTGGASILDGEGKVSLAPAGMIIETPLAKSLFDGDIIPDFNDDQRPDLVLVGNGGRSAVLLTPGTIFEEGQHIVVDEQYLNGERAFSYFMTGSSSTHQTLGWITSDSSMPADFNGDGISDLLIIGEGRAHLLYGHAGPFINFTSGDERLHDGENGTELAKLWNGWGPRALQTGDFDGDGFMDWAQARAYSTLFPGSADRFEVYYGSDKPYPGVYAEGPSFSFKSGTAPVGNEASLSNATDSGARVDLNGDKIDDLVFTGLASNNNMFGGCYLYVKFGTKERLTQLGAAPNGSLDGANGFKVSHSDYPKNSLNFSAQDGADVNGDGVEDLILTGGGNPLTVIFGKKTPFASGSYSKLAELGSEAALFETAKVTGVRVGDLNGDGIGDIIFVTENKLRVVWGRKDLKGMSIIGTAAPEVGEIDIEPTSGLDNVSMVGDLDGDMVPEVVLLSRSWKGDTGASLVLFGKTLTSIFGSSGTGGPN